MGKFIKILLLVFLTSSFDSRALALGQADDLGLAGSRVLAFAQGGGIVFAAARGPRGIYASDDFGANWTFATGGEYSTGSGTAVITTSNNVFAILRRGVFAGDLALSPNWQSLDFTALTTLEKLEIPLALAADSTTLFVSTSYARVLAFSLNTLALTGSTTITQVSQDEKPEKFFVPRIAVIGDNSNRRLFVLLGAIGRGGGQIMRATYSRVASPEAVTIGSWEDVSPSHPALPNGNLVDPPTCPPPTATARPTLAPGVTPTVTRTPLPCAAVNCGSFGGVFAADSETNSQDRVYVTTARKKSLVDEDYRGVYVSQDGALWARVVTPVPVPTGTGAAEVESDFDTFNIRTASFNGQSHVLGRFVDTGGGCTFVDEIPTDEIPGDVGLDGQAMLMGADGTTCITPLGTGGGSNCAMASTVFGPMVSRNLESGPASEWSQAFTGLQGVLVTDISQAADAPDIAVLAVDGGIARTTNFTSSNVGYDRRVPFVGSDARPQPVFAVAIDPTDSNVVYVGARRLFRATFSGNSDPTWQTIDAISNHNVREIIATAGRLYVIYGRVRDSVDGDLRIYNKSGTTLTSKLTTVATARNKPLSALLVIPGSSDGSDDVVYIGVGGAKSTEDEGSSTSKLGLVRSSDGGETFSQILDDDQIVNGHIPALAYDSTNDVLYAAGNEQGIEDELEGFTAEEKSDETEVGGGTVFIVKKASTDSFKISTPSKGLPTDRQVTALTVDNKNGTGTVFAALGKKLYQSNSLGDKWALLLEGLTDEATSSLFFDELTQGSTAGFSSVTGNPNLIISSITSKVRAGTRKSIEVTFSKNFLDTDSNRRRLQAKINDIRVKTIKRDALTLALKPQGSSWPSGSKKFSVRVKPGFLADDGEGLDSNYDEAIDGNLFKGTVKITN